MWTKSGMIGLPPQTRVKGVGRQQQHNSSGLELCWPGAGRRYLLMVGSIRVSKTFGAGQRREMGRYEVPWNMSLPGFRIWTINEATQSIIPASIKDFIHHHPMTCYTTYQESG